MIASDFEVSLEKELLSRGSCPICGENGLRVGIALLGHSTPVSVRCMDCLSYVEVEYDGLNGSVDAVLVAFEEVRKERILREIERS